MFIFMIINFHLQQIRELIHFNITWLSSSFTYFNILFVMISFDRFCYVIKIDTFIINICLWLINIPQLKLKLNYESFEVISEKQRKSKVG